LIARLRPGASHRPPDRDDFLEREQHLGKRGGFVVLEKSSRCWLEAQYAPELA
jgi:hypothetical protein